MNHIKVYHQDGLVYFDQFRIAELLLVHHAENKYWLVIDIKTFDAQHPEDRARELELEFQTAINNDRDYCWVYLEEYYEFNSPDDIYHLFIDSKESESIYLYFGWHVPMHHNLITISGSDKSVDISWDAMAGDINYYDERAKDNKVQITGRLQVFMFKNQEAYQEHEALKSKRHDTYYSILRSLQGHEEEDPIDVSALKDLPEAEQNRIAWKMALERNP